MPVSVPERQTRGVGTMGASIYYFAGPSDSQVFSEYAQSLGLRILPPLFDNPQISPTNDPCEGPFCFLSPRSKDELHPYGQPAKISDALDPLIEFWRSYYRSPDLLVIGRLHCSNDVGDLHETTKTNFSRLAKWIKGNWKKLPTGQYIGPEAETLVNNGAKLVYFPPGINIEEKIIS